VQTVFDTREQATLHGSMISVDLLTDLDEHNLASTDRVGGAVLRRGWRRVAGRCNSLSATGAIDSMRKIHLPCSS